MSGHSHWATIKRQKGAADVKRGAVFTKLAREIAAAAREGGGDSNFNLRLRLAIQKAKGSNMPAENIDRAVKRGTGGDGGASLMEVTYEGYTPGGAAVLVQAMTDNRNRTTAEVRALFTHSNGNMAEAGSVTWIFERKGLIVLQGDEVSNEALTLAAIDAGADDFQEAQGAMEISTPPEALEHVLRVLEEKGAPVTSSEVAYIPKTTVELDERAASQALRLLEHLEELEDVQQVFTNANFPESSVEERKAS